MRLKKGDLFPSFTYINQNREVCNIEDIYVKFDNTVVLFLRYYGCSVCQLDLLEYKDRYNELKSKNAEVVIVLQSTPESLDKQAGEFPYQIICDSEMELYKKFEIKPAKSTFGMLSLKLFSRLKKVKALGLEHGDYEGDEKQLPAMFIINRQGDVAFSKYAKSLTDYPTFDELLEKI